MERVIITTDGSCLGNPGPGGWACIFRKGDEDYRKSGWKPDTTNNEMEATAVQMALRAAPRGYALTLRIDSTYVLNNLKRDLEKAKWETTTGKEIKHKKIWQEITELKKKFPSIEYVKVEAHGDDVDNIECDCMARRAAILQDRVPTKKIEGSLYQYVTKAGSLK